MWRFIIDLQISRSQNEQAWQSRDLLDPAAERELSDESK